jgi:protein-disulfide isomerase
MINRKDRNMIRKFLFIATATAALSACNGAGDASNDTKSTAKGVTAPASTKWSETTAMTPDSGVRMGNPAAPVKLVEYGALTCSHCAEFSEKSTAGLKELVDKGTVSYEFRNFMLNGIDVPAALLARCGGPGPFFPISEQLFATQRDWLAKTQSFTPDDQAKAAKMTPIQQAAFVAERLGLIEFVQQRGISADKAKACLADGKAADELVKMTDRAVKEFKVEGTPTFVINGVTVKGVGTWEDLKPKLIEAGA